MTEPDGARTGMRQDARSQQSRIIAYPGRGRPRIGLSRTGGAGQAKARYD